jgi:DNA-binding CsgD family transcriptional regulator
MKGTKRATRPREGYHWFRGWRQPTEAQRRVLDELVAGGTNAQIAERLGISEDGVKWHLAELRQELGLDDRRQLAEWWLAQRRRAGILLPLAGLWRSLAGHAAAPAIVAGAAVASVAIGWFAYQSLRAEDGESAGAATARTPFSVAVAPFVPTPTATPVPATALVLDVVERTATTLPGGQNNRRWLDTRTWTFVAASNEGPVIVDAEGSVEPVEGAENAVYFPVVDGGEVLLWYWATGKLTVLDAASMDERDLLDLAADEAPNRVAAISPMTGRFAVTESNLTRLLVIATHEGRVVFSYEVPDGHSVLSASWSPDGARLLVLSGRRDASGHVRGSERLVVFDNAGNRLLDRDGSARWAGNRWLHSELTSSGGSLLSTVYYSLDDGSELPAPNARDIVCFSPNSRYGILVQETRLANAPSIAYRHRVVDLETGEAVLEAEVSQFLVNCDWTPDGKRVVLSPGGK